MSNTRTRIKLGTIAQITMGQSPASETYNTCNIGLPFLQGNRTFGTKYPLFDTWTDAPTKTADAGDVIMSVRAPVGDLNITPVKMCLGRGVCSLKAISGDNEFLYYALKASMKSIISNGSKGTVFDSINREDLKNLEMFIPETSNEQKKISTILSNIDSVIEINTALSSTLEETAKTLYDYWFTQFDFPNEEGKPYRSSGGKMVWNEELKREIPEGWEVDTLRNKYKLSRGISYTSKNIETNSGTPMLNLACVSIERKYRDGELKYFSGDIADDKFVNEGDLLIASTDLTRNADIVGCPILVPNDGNKYTYSMDLVKFIPNEALFDSFYLSMALQTTSYHNYIKKWASGTNVLHLNLDGIAWYKTCIPPITLQKKFGLIIKQIHNNNGRILAENRRLSSLRDYLLPLLMNGQITIGK